MRRRARHETGGIGPRRRRRGAAAAEAASVLPLLVTMLLGTLELGRAYEARGIIAGAAREAARLASSGRIPHSNIDLAVRTYAARAGLRGTPVLTIRNADQTGANSTNMPHLALPTDRLQVTVSIPYKDVLWTSFFFTTRTNLLTITTTWGSTSDPN